VKSRAMPRRKTRIKNVGSPPCPVSEPLPCQCHDLFVSDSTDRQCAEVGARSFQMEFQLGWVFG
jgi:hypothetical protein